jgi:hypothetical protein
MSDCSAGRLLGRRQPLSIGAFQGADGVVHLLQVVLELRVALLKLGGNALAFGGLFERLLGIDHGHLKRRRGLLGEGRGGQDKHGDDDSCFSHINLLWRYLSSGCL